jgi:hypothetical protein
MRHSAEFAHPMDRRKQRFLHCRRNPMKATQISCAQKPIQGSTLAMGILAPAILACLSFGFIHGGAYARTAPSPRDAASAQTLAGIMDLHVKARGGIQAFKAIHTMEATGTISFGGSAPGGIRVLAVRPSSFRVDIHQGAATIIQAYDGKNGWQIQSTEGKGAPASITGGALADLQDQAENAIGGPLLDYAARGSRVDLMGEQLVGGKSCYKLKITLRSAHLIYIYLDKSTYLEVKEELPRTINGQEKLIVETVGDYRKFGGWLFPCSFVSGIDGNAGETLQIQNVKINLPVNETTFKMPVPAAATPTP